MASRSSIVVVRRLWICSPYQHSSTLCLDTFRQRLGISFNNYGSPQDCKRIFASLLPFARRSIVLRVIVLSTWFRVHWPTTVLCFLSQLLFPCVNAWRHWKQWEILSKSFIVTINLLGFSLMADKRHSYFCSKVTPEREKYYHFTSTFRCIKIKFI